MHEAVAELASSLSDRLLCPAQRSIITGPSSEQLFDFITINALNVVYIPAVIVTIDQFLINYLFFLLSKNISAIFLYYPTQLCSSLNLSMPFLITTQYLTYFVSLPSVCFFPRFILPRCKSTYFCFQSICSYI